MTPLAVERALLGVDRIALHVRSHNMKPCDEEKVSGHTCIAGVTMNIFFFTGEGEVWGVEGGEGCVLRRNPRKKFQYQIQGPGGMVTR